MLVTTVSAQESPRNPILIIPGISGSWNWDVMMGSALSDEWNFPPTDRTFENLINALEEAGLERDKDFYVVFYDWRQSNADSAVEYLMPAIARALENSDAEKVDIIAHSMGGLVARYYILSNAYQNDVANYITLGTPHYGSSDIYPLWEGGEIPENWNKTQQNVMGFYLWYLTTVTGQTADGYDTIHQHVPSVGEMLPVYEYLIDKETGDVIDDDDMVEQNFFLKDLDDRMGGQGQNFRARIEHFSSIAGTGVDTVGEIPVKPFEPPTPEEEKLWVDGIPDPRAPEKNTTEGDNRVLVDSTYFDFDPIIPTKHTPSWLERALALVTPYVKAQSSEASVEHIVLDGAGHGALPTLAIDEVFNILDLPEPDEYAVIPEPEEILSFWLASPLTIQIIDPEGNVVSATTTEISGAEYDAESDPLGVKMITIPNPKQGEYRVEMRGLVDGSYHLGVATFGSTDLTETVEGDIEENEGIGYTVAYNPDTPLDPASISDPFPIEEEEDPALLTEDLATIILVLDEYYSSGAIKNKLSYGVLKSLVRAAKGSVEQYESIETQTGKIAAFKRFVMRAAAIWNMEQFLKTTAELKKKGQITSEAALNLEGKGNAALARIKLELQ